MRFMLWSMLRKNNEGEVDKKFEPKYLANIATVAKGNDIDALLLYEVPFMPTDNKWNYLRDSLHGGGWQGFLRATYHYDWGILYLSKMEIDHVEVSRFNDADDTRDFDFLDASGRTAITIIHSKDQENFALSPAVTFFHCNPQQNSAIRCETVDMILGSLNLEEGEQHILAGNLIDNEKGGQLYSRILKPLNYESASETLTLPAKKPEYKADSIFIKNLEVKLEEDTTYLMTGNSLEHKPLIVELA